MGGAALQGLKPYLCEASAARLNSLLKKAE